MLSIAATNYIEVNTTLPGPVHAWLLIVVFVAVTDDDMYVSLDATKYCIKSQSFSCYRGIGISIFMYIQISHSPSSNCICFVVTILQFDPGDVPTNSRSECGQVFTKNSSFFKVALLRKDCCRLHRW